MSINSFDTEIAKEVGINAAVIYQNIAFWCEKNKANGKNIHDGKVWTYNSNRAFSELFPYLTQKQIRTALLKLESSGFLEVGNFNKSNYDRTKWYTCTRLNSQFDLPKRENESDRKGKPIPDSKPDSKQNNNQQADLLGLPEEEKPQKPDLNKAFDMVWKYWHNKVGKEEGRNAFLKAFKNYTREDLIAEMEHIEAYREYALNQLQNKNNAYLGFNAIHFSKFINNKRWLDLTKEELGIE